MLLIDATPLQSEHRMRGVGVYLRELIKKLEEIDDLKPYYLVSTFGLEHTQNFLPAERLVKVVRPHTPAQVYWFYNEPALRLALYHTRPQVFFAPDFNGLVSNPFGKTVTVLYDLTAYKLLSNRSKTLRDLSTRLSDLRWNVYYQKLKRADHIIAISHSAKQDAMRLLNIPPERIRVIQLGVDLESFSPIPGLGSFANHPPYFVNLGGRNDNKNQARILQAFAKVATDHPEVQLYFAGPWRDPDHAWLRARSSELGLEGRVSHVGYVAASELPSLFSNALAFVFPSLEEGFGLPVLEAMACGAPVITSNRSSLPEVAGDAALLIDPFDTDAIAAALHRILTDSELRHELSRQGIERAKGFTWEETAKQTITILRQVTAV